MASGRKDDRIDSFSLGKTSQCKSQFIKISQKLRQNPTMQRQETDEQIGLNQSAKFQSININERGEFISSYSGCCIHRYVKMPTKLLRFAD